MITKTINIRRQSKAYIDNLARWQYYLASYLGGEDYINFKYNNTPTLEQHDREGDIPGKYNKRLKRAYYLNYCKHVVNTYANFIFSGKDKVNRIVANGDDTIFIESYISDIDGKLTNINEFMEKLFRLSLIYGESYIWVDKMKTPDDVLSESQAKQIGYRAYAKILTPLDVMDFSIDDNGEYRWVLIKEQYIENSNPFKDAETIVNYRLITRDEMILYNDDNKIIDQVPNSIKIVPIIKCVLTDIDGNGVGESFLKDIIGINLEIFNTSSYITEEIKQACFPLLYGPEIVGDTNSEANTNIRSVQSYIEVNKDAIAPAFIAPPSTTVDVKRAYIDGLIMEILRLAGLQKDDAVTSNSQASGISKAISFLDTDQSFSQKSLRTQQVEQKMWDIIRLYDGIKQNITVKYPYEFDVISKVEKNKILQDILLVTESQTAKKRIYMELFKSNVKASDDQLKAIELELDKESEEVENNTVTEEVQIEN